MDTPSSLGRTIRTAGLLASLLVLSGCAAAPNATAPSAAPAPSPTASAASDGHGVDGGSASEVSSPASALIIGDENGGITLLDLATETRESLRAGEGDADSIQSDGRFVYVTHADRAAVDVIDTARWTVPHGDHTHSFRGEPRLVGTLAGDGDLVVTAGEQRAALQFPGEFLVISHEELAHEELTPEADALAEIERRPSDATGPIVPFADHLLIPTADTSIEIADADGAPLSGEGMPCTDVTDADVTRVGVVFACAEGAVLFTREVGGAVVGESIPTPHGAPAPTQLSGRADRPDLAGIAGDRGAWLLDVRARAWTLLPSDVPLVAAVAIGDDESRTIVLDSEGRVRILDPTGEVLVRTEPLLAASVADPSTRERVRLIVDAQHVYVSDPASGAVYELDHRDSLHITRTFADLDPWFLQLVG
ncbi:MAG: hypothetical protein P0Y60_03105 [Candidatus Microbacterium colombiense]|nr:MAG: hypothetical protein P0Y60_03105 [Microbacterium sp.]